MKIELRETFKEKTGGNSDKQKSSEAKTPKINN